MQHLLLRVAYGEYASTAPDPPTSTPPTRSWTMAQKVRASAHHGIDLPGEASGRIADRTWRRSYWEQNKDTTASRPRSRPSATSPGCSPGSSAPRAWYYRAGDAVNFRSARATPWSRPSSWPPPTARSQRRHAVGAPRRQGRRQPGRHEGPRDRAQGRGPRPGQIKKRLKYIDTALKGTAKPGGTVAWKFGDFRSTTSRSRAKTGTAEVQGKQTNGWVATYDEKLRRRDDDRQGGNRLGQLGRLRPRDLERSSTRFTRRQGRQVQGAPAGRQGARGPATFAADGSIKAPGAAR